MEPNAVNSVPRVAELYIDLRDIVHTRRDRLLAMIQQNAQQIADRRKVRYPLFCMLSAPCDSWQLPLCPLMRFHTSFYVEVLSCDIFRDRRHEYEIQALGGCR